ncbi:hypothetical protein DVK85_05040 [Flavobacterium arcticum]|uniref:SMI1/KNR4 family protein n=1 Tax=Flavobacterium arcticum TaxID=1784713 RepID=A0A345HAL9_9FLAO|nr:hypothetical protein [Flavobacterium arcticum]AXG73629.1 hypothetical protein DVK85_05040 [Flavobacterium arcticum]KAF2511579.1 hypothetical protein E0W72_04550 [Flavobacterium arcticum]
MQIEYLQDLLNYPTRPGNTKSYWFNTPIPETEITALEDLYNNGAPFPKALQELLYLAGDYCYVLDYGINESQQELQEDVRELINEYGKQITRPFYAVDVYNGNDQCLFIYLDEGDDPFVHEGYYSDPESTWITKLKLKLSEFINYRVKRVQEGRSPF